MLGLKEGNPIDMLRQFAVYYNATLIEDFGAARLVLKNDQGKGSIGLYEVMPGLTAWIYNLKLNSDLVINLKFSKNDLYYFGYNVSGFQLQKFDNEKEYQTIQQSQNFILLGKENTVSEFIIPKDMAYKCCYLLIDPELLNNNNSKRRLQSDLKETFEFAHDTLPYRYFGDIDTKIGAYADIIVTNKRTDLVGRLLTEGAIMNMLGSQIEAHDQDKKAESFQVSLTKQELSRITDLGDYIIKNIDGNVTIKEISKHLELSQKKVRVGVKFLYGVSINEYQSNVRLEKAKELILTTQDSISEVCYIMGYSSRSYFSKIFKARYGVSPKEYKKTFKKEY